MTSRACAAATLIWLESPWTESVSGAMASLTLPPTASTLAWRVTGTSRTAAARGDTVPRKSSTDSSVALWSISVAVVRSPVAWLTLATESPILVSALLVIFSSCPGRMRNAVDTGSMAAFRTSPTFRPADSTSLGIAEMTALNGLTTLARSAVTASVTCLRSSDTD